MVDKIACEFCSKTIVKTYLRQHQKTKGCLSAQHTKDCLVDRSTPAQRLFIVDLPDDILGLIFEYTQQKHEEKYGKNGFGILRLVNKQFYTGVKQAANQFFKLYIGIEPVCDIDALILILARNRYVGTTRACDNFCITATVANKLRETGIHSKVYGWLLHKEEVIRASIHRFGSISKCNEYKEQKLNRRSQRPPNINKLMREPLCNLMYESRFY